MGSSTKNLLLLCSIGSVLLVVDGRRELLESSNSALAFWEQNLPLVKIPTQLANAASPLQDVDVSSYVHQIEKNGDLTAIPQFCDTAKLYCDASFNTAGVRQCDKIYIYELQFACRAAESKADFPQVFFHEKALLEAEYINVADLQDKEPFRAALPKALADAFSGNMLPNSAELFNIPSSSMLGQTLKETSSLCRDGSGKCAASLEDLALLGRPYSNLHYQASATAGPLVHAKVLKLSAVPVKERTMLACHSLMFPYRIFYCHELNTQEINVYKVSVQGATDDLLAVCHTDTSSWNVAHQAFTELKSSPGKTNACHFLPQNHMLWY